MVDTVRICAEGSSGRRLGVPDDDTEPSVGKELVESLRGRKPGRGGGRPPGYTGMGGIASLAPLPPRSYCDARDRDEDALRRPFAPSNEGSEGGRGGKLPDGPGGPYGDLGGPCPILAAKLPSRGADLI